MNCFIFFINRTLPVQNEADASNKGVKVKPNLPVKKNNLKSR